jgi:hypothetical protein
MNDWYFPARGMAIALVVAGACVIFAVVRATGAPFRDTPPAPTSPAPTSPAPTSPATTTPATTEPATTEPAKPDPSAKTDADPDQATIDQWRKHVEKWKAIDPREAADNSFCYVCHANYEGEKLVKGHESVGVGCETCHGRSDKHSQDEDSLVPPDVIFDSARVARFCAQCHEKRDLLDGDEAHEQFFAGQVESDKTCTSCHEMKHMMKVRTRRWDKETRKLEWYDGVRMMQQRDEKPAESGADAQSPK